MWLYRSSVLASAVIMLVSFIKPWWVGRFSGGEEIVIYGWGLRYDYYFLLQYITGDITPLWQTVIAWLYVEASIVLSLLATWMSKWKGSILLGVLGVGLISYACVAQYVVISKRLGAYNISLQGISLIQQTIHINADIGIGYYLAVIAGGLWVGLAIVRALIQPKKLSGNTA